MFCNSVNYATVPVTITMLILLRLHGVEID